MWFRVCVIVLLLLIVALVGIAGVPWSLGVALGGALVAGIAVGIWRTQRRLRWAAAALERALVPEDAHATGGETRLGAVLHDFKARTARGAVALAEMPIYVALGAPQSGKRTLLQHAGLTWSARDVRSVAGGAWWLASECAVLRPTDLTRLRPVLDALYRQRPQAPVNGFWVTLNLEDLLALPEGALRAQAQTLRRDLDVLQQQLHTRAPIYLMVTKCDTLAGFVETFTGLSAAARDRIWGKIFPRQDSVNAAEQITGQLDAMVQAIGQELFGFIDQDAEPTARERVFQFPEQLASLRSPLLAWANGFFATSHRRAPPRLRGMFFSSAHKGSYAYDRVAAPSWGTTTVRVTTGAGHPGPYFTQRIFSRGILPDAAYHTAVAAHQEHRWARHVAMGAALALAALPCLPFSQSVWALWRSRQVIEEGAQQETGADAKLASLSSLDRLRDQMASLQAARGRATALNVHSGMDESVVLEAAVKTLYLHVLRDAVLAPMVAWDGQQLLIFAERHAQDFSELTDREYKTYADKLRMHLLLSGFYEADEHIFDNSDAAWLTDSLSRRWAHGLDYEFDAPVQGRMAEHIAFYLQERKSHPELLLPRDVNATAEVRQILARVPVATVVMEEALDNAEAYTLTLGQVVGGAPVPLYSDGQIRGGFTRDGWENVVRQQLHHVVLTNNVWVLGPEREHAVEAYLAGDAEHGLQAEYWQRGLAQWQLFVSSIHPVPPRDAQDAAVITARLQNLTHLREAIRYNFAGADVPAEVADSARDLADLGPLNEQMTALRDFGAPEYGAAHSLVQRLR